MDFDLNKGKQRTNVEEFTTTTTNKMTAPRIGIARAGRTRFFICLFVFILMIGFIAIFQNSQQQLDELRQVGLRCEQQQESLAAQMKGMMIVCVFFSPILEFIRCVFVCGIHF